MVALSPRLPPHLAGGDLEGQVFVFQAGEHEEEVGEAVDVAEDVGVTQGLSLLEGDDAALGFAGQGAGKVERA